MWHCSCMRAIFATSFNSPFIYYAPFGMCFSSIRFVCLINVKHSQNNGYNEYKYNEWSRKCGFSVLATVQNNIQKHNVLHMLTFVVEC